MSAPPAQIPNEVISASAGSGKTHALTNRYLQLVAAGADPASVIALTFTRKAAGEFLDRIVGRLAAAAADAGKAAALSEELGLDPPGEPPRFLALLRQLTGELHRLGLGTLDGFFARLVSAAPFELGLTGEPEVVGDTVSEEAARRRVLDEVFAATAVQGETLRAFLRALSEASYGRGASRMRSVLEGFVDRYHQLVLDVPDPGLWGEASAVWPGGSEFLDAVGDPGQLRAKFDRLREVVGAAEATAGQREWWDQFFADAEDYSPGAPPGSRMGGILEKLTVVRDALPSGGCSIKMDRKDFTFDVRAGHAAREVLDAVAGAEFQAKLRRTRALRAVLGAYESVYDRRRRRAGKLGFSDLAVVLGRALGTAGEIPADLAYRTDSRFDHWLIDEFQDTSRAQWKVISGLVDEVLQDPEARRTYFQVGDKKQSIYGWRGGDPTLVDEVREKYWGRLTVGSLDRSYRSVPAVLDTVNQVFGDSHALAGLLPAGAVERLEWHTHLPSDHNEGRPGFACLLHPGEPPEGSRGDPSHQLALGVVREVDPLRRGLSCAVLCETQKAVREVVDCFRANGFNEVVSGARVKPAVDNPVCGAVLALLRAAGFPGDSFAAGHVRMTPVAAACLGDAGWDAGLETVLRQVGGGGFEAFVRDCWSRIDRSGALGDDPGFAQHRLSNLTEVARAFDAGGNRSIPEFLAFAEGAEREEAPDAGVVQVMTVHASKGLGFDLVVLPDLKGKNLVQSREGLAVGGIPARPAWVLDPPRKLFRELDQVLAAQLAAAEEDSAFESLCRLYVAMTRPKQGLYLVAPQRGKTSKATDFTLVLEDLLGGDGDGGGDDGEFGGVGCTVRYAHGERGWFETHPLVEAGRRPEPAPDGPIGLGPRHRLARRSPSGFSTGGVTRAGALAFGRDVHAALATVGWLDAGAPVPEFGEITSDAARVVEKCLADPAVRSVFSKPAGSGALLWREKPFEAIVDGEWVSGTFDRVVVERDGDRLTWATVVEFKTDQVVDQDAAQERAETHRAQLDLYRRAVSQLTGLPPDSVGGAIVFTSLPAVVDD